MSYSTVARQFFDEQLLQTYEAACEPAYMEAMQADVHNFKTSTYMVKNMWHTHQDVQESYQWDRLDFPDQAKEARNTVYAKLGMTYQEHAAVVGRSVKDVQSHYAQYEAGVFYKTIISSYHTFFKEGCTYRDVRLGKSHKSTMRVRRRGRQALGGAKRVSALHEVVLSEREDSDSTQEAENYA